MINTTCIKEQGFSVDWMNPNANIALCTLFSSRRQNLRHPEARRQVLLDCWLVVCFCTFLRLAGNTLNTQHALQYLIRIRTLEPRCAMTEKHGDRACRRPCVWKRFFELHEYRNSQKTIVLLAPLYFIMCSKF